jgi:two-component system sensor histidine kinase BaeS
MGSATGLAVNEMAVSLRAKLASSYILLVIICVVLISLLANLFLEKQFRDYVIKNQERRNQQVVASISQQVGVRGEWHIQDIADLGINALEQGLILKVKDDSGRMIWDATAHNSGMCEQMISHMAENMFSRYPNWKGGYMETTYPVVRGVQKIGTVEIGYYGPFYFDDVDLAFINTLNRILLGVTTFALFAAFIVAALMAKGLSAPIARVIETAQMIAKGSYQTKSREKSSIRELNQLTRAINDLAGTLEKQEQIRKQLTADVAHELRTPLATLQSHIEAILDGVWKAEPERLKVCHNEVMRLNRMVADLGKLAKYESENLILDRTEFDLTALIRQLILNFESEFVRKGVTIDLSGETALIFADRDKISQVMINLIANGLKFTPAGGRVEIAIIKRDNEIEIRIKDSGCGIAEADLPFVFERFYRADKSRSRLTGGSGIGLTIVKTLVEAHQGRITVNSKPGSGTEFVIFLPSII